MATKYATLNKVILFTAETYIEQCRQDGTQPTAFHLKLLSRIRSWKSFNKFTQDEAKTVMKLSEDEELKKILDKPVSFLVFTLELMKQLIEHYDLDQVPKKDRPYIGISEKKLAGGRALYTISMLKLKQRDEEEYNKTRDVINDSVVVAKHFFNYHYERLVK